MKNLCHVCLFKLSDYIVLSFFINLMPASSDLSNWRTSGSLMFDLQQRTNNPYLTVTL